MEKSKNVTFEARISLLFDNAERLYPIRSDLVKIADAVHGRSEQLAIILSVKVVDLMRITLLYEYELLDTSHVIRDDYVSSYYARRIDILVMTKEQILGHLKELQDLQRQISLASASDCIDQACEIIESSLHVVNETVAFLEKDIVAAGAGQTKH